MKTAYFIVIASAIVIYAFLSVNVPTEAVLFILPVILAVVAAGDEFRKDN